MYRIFLGQLDNPDCMGDIYAGLEDPDCTGSFKANLEDPSCMGSYYAGLTVWGVLLCQSGMTLYLWILQTGKKGCQTVAIGIL